MLMTEDEEVLMHDPGFAKDLAAHALIDAHEFGFLERLTHERGHLDDQSLQALHIILSRVSQEEVDLSTWEEMREFREMYGV
jgi:hypothetical protein